MTQLVLRTGELIDILIASGIESDADLMREVCELMLGDIVYRSFGFSRIRCKECGALYTSVYPIPCSFPLLCDECGEYACVLFDEGEDEIEVEFE